MSYGYAKRRVDDNQNSIVKALRFIPGMSIALTHIIGDGFPDMIIGYNGINYLIELKDGNKPPSQRKLTPDEIKWHEKWEGQVNVCKNLDEILKLIGINVK